MEKSACGKTNSEPLDIVFYWLFRGVKGNEYGKRSGNATDKAFVEMKIQLSGR